ncbi:acylphosphatase [Lacisediminimonas profundi]|uniref:acylphosphatase n=1 Tax=Lacisediminimonas profundi TaxID=2603856 RepID=UPI00124BB0F4|nr:acylphosphatase [Lacisediminimonas profundi]
MTAARLVITGMVQGVGYRASFAREALSLQLDGWVRNRSDGAVEALVAGEQHAIDAIIGWSRKGPPAACVIGVSVTREDVQLAPGFRIAAGG